MPTAVIYKRIKKGYLAYANIKAVSGFSVSTDPYIQIPESNAGADIIADAIRKVLETDDNKRVPNPKNWSEHSKLFLRKIGLKSLNELHEPATLCCVIVKEKDNIIFTPTKHADTPEEGFLHKSKVEAITIPIISSDQEIADAVELAFSKCD